MKNFKVNLMSFIMTFVMMIGLLGTGTVQVFADGTGYSSQINSLINSMSPSITQNMGDWQTLDLNKAGKEVPGSYLTNLESNIKSGSDSLSLPTDYERTSLGILAAGGDPTNFAGMNLIEKIYNNEGIKDQGINAYVFALIALDAGKFNIPDGSKWTRDSLIQGILDNRTTDGGWSYSGGSADPDMTGMALSALAPYYGTNANVKSAVDGAVEILANIEKNDGGFASWSPKDGGGDENANSVAMVIIGLCDSNVDPTTDSRFTKNGKNPLDALLSYTVSDNSGFGYTDNKSVNGMATEQGFRALAAYNLFKESKGSVYKNFAANTSDTKVTGISLDKTSANLTEGDSLQLTPTITPKDATNTKVDWSSSDKTIAAVDGNGKVTAVKAGTATITATTEDGQKTAVCAITIIAKTVPDKTIHVSMIIDGYKGNMLTDENIEAAEGQTVYSMFKNELAAKGITYKNPDGDFSPYISDIAGETEKDRGAQSGWKYSVNGVFPNVGCGSVNLKDGDKVHWIYVEGAWDEFQFRDVDSISLDKQSLNLNVNGTEKLTATIDPDNATDKDVTWKSSDPTVAAVDKNGTVTAVKAGTATITAASVDNDRTDFNQKKYVAKTAQCTVIVNSQQPQTVKVTGVSLDKTSANLTTGDTLQLTPTITPKDATNTKVDWSNSDKTIVAVDENGKITAVKAGTATITAVSEDNKDAKAQCTVTVSDKKQAVQVDLSVTGYKGSILDAKSIEVEDGKTVEQVVKQVLDDKKIEYTDDNGYFSMIGNESERDRGAISGWMYDVNGIQPSVGMKDYKVKKGDKIGLFFTSDFGKTMFRDIDKISLDNTKMGLNVGDIQTIRANVSPITATETVNWSSSDPTIAAVDSNGKVMAVKTGTATITASGKYNKTITAQCAVTIVQPLVITNLTTEDSFKLGDDAKISVKTENNSGKDQDASLIVALYDEGGKFINYVCGRQTIKNGDSSILTTMMKLPEEGAYKLKAFIWDSLESMNIISDSIDIPVQSK
ncbi:Ig-like domain-containing protein [Clostridium ljungdahlii]|uniref:Bacterial Ig-like domain (Group 2) n=1 Tax=Clostridium ljungdahlii TaxID=1538 RepID=A0A162J947_9CLOT|nr:Ig-like domain-containing protein [Clostridium ljungdahlii]OAA92075.1 Bacterial Ig-like domain (group 2) [Clostridium ljungdahlii]